MRLPIIDGDQAKIDIEKFKEMADAFIAAGGTYFDTAYPYHGGKSECAFREAIVKRYPRESFTVTDKLPVFLIDKQEQFEEIFSEQLERCGVEYFDYYWLHALNSANYEKVQNLKAFDFIKEKQAEGKIRHIGFSFHDSAEVLERILTDHPEVEYVQLQINYLDWEDAAIQSKECYETAVRHGKPVIVMEPVKGGALANIPEEAERLFKEQSEKLSAASWAIRYAASKESVFTVLSGMSNIEQVRDNISYMKDFKPLSEREEETVMKAADIIRYGIEIPCTACRYCVSENKCPKNIAIPDYFALYNDKKKIKSGGSAADYNNLSLTHGKASECIGCGQCEKHCPQHLPIREYLKDVAKAME